MIDVTRQMPLFEWYSINVEFARRRDWILSGLRSDWQNLKNLTDEEINFRCWAPDVIVPIDLDGARKIEKCVCPSGVFDYQVSIYFSGDEELWRLYPGRFPDSLPDGEIFRNHLILAFIAADDAEAERIVGERLDQIEPFLEIQRDLIEEFHDNLPEVIKAEILRLRGAGGPPFPSGGSGKRRPSLYLVE